jgi:hypothetical protein
MAVVMETRRIQHLGGHRVLHDVDTAAGVLRESEPTQDADHREVASGTRLPDVVHRDRLRETARGADDKH